MNIPIKNGKVIRRTFEAEKHPKGSEERNRLNCNPITSEYLHGERYLVIWDAIMDDGTPNPSQEFHNRGFRTKHEAEEWLKARMGGGIDAA